MKRLVTGLLSFIMLWLSIPTASALGTLPAPNEQQRHIVCTSLSDAAQAYYHDGCQYDSLSALPGAADPVLPFVRRGESVLVWSRPGRTTSCSTRFIR